MTFQVYHRDVPNFTDNTAATLTAFPQGFTRVAEVSTDTVEDVFELTNHIDSDWTKNDGVTPARLGSIRSTSVGDVVTHKGTELRRWTVDGFGMRSF